MSFCLKIFLVYRNLQNKTTKIITFLPPATKLRQGNIFTPVTGRVTANHPGQTPHSRHPRADTPPPSACWDTPSPAQCMLGYGQQAGGTHPTGMHSCFFVFPFTILKYIAILDDNTYHPYRTTLNRRHNI